MLSHASSRAVLVCQSTLPRAVAAELANALLNNSSLQRRSYSHSTSSKQWAVTANRKVSSNAAHLRQAHRPIVNGQTVAFHVHDLIRASTTTASLPPPPSPSLLRNSNKSTPRRYYDNDLVVVLDMDECLIHAQFSSSQNAQSFAHQLLKQKRSNQTSAVGLVDSFRFTLPDGDLVHVNLRPGLREFLKAVTSKYETHIFTAAMEVYAKPLLDELEKDGSNFAGRWYREHCVYDPAQQAYVKDLDRLPFLSSGKRSSLDRVVLVDNNPLSFLANPSNGILVSSFYNDPTDTSLESVWQLLQELDCQPDVRPHLEERFGLKSALSGIHNKA